MKEYCKGQIKEVDIRISNYFKRIKDPIENRNVGELSCHTYDEKNKYLYKKAKDYKLEKDNVNLSKDTNTERQIEEINKNLMKKVENDLNKPIDTRNINVDELLKAYKLNEFCNLGNKLEQNKTTLKEVNSQINKIENFIWQADKNKEVLSNVKKSLENMDKYKDIAEKYDNKILFKKSFQSKFEDEKNTYDRAQNYLKSVGITSWEKYSSVKKEFNKSESIAETLKGERTKLKSMQDNLYEGTTKQQNAQKTIIKELGDANITQSQVKSNKVMMEMER